jgi:hypothetical protein
MFFEFPAQESHSEFCVIDGLGEDVCADTRDAGVNQSRGTGWVVVEDMKL